ncbi:MAG TPA: IclR family transcriptional regulator C-terminal domain-containing protein [Pseudolysinimonas sp.]|nr:IclR family transcriptional regulator C-terminal domain-containing protein [Pseudolysinimonas sp.]
METAQTADYALRVLIELENHDSRTIAELSDSLDISRSVVQRMITTLHGRAMVVKRDEGRYSLGPGLIGLGSNLPHELVIVARPYMRELTTSSREMVALTVPDGDEAVIVARRKGSNWPLRVEYEIGFRHPLSLGGDGLAILAFQERSEEAEQLSPHLAEVLADVRQRGYVSTSGELREHLVCLAAPILAGPLGVVGSLAIVVPSERAEQLNNSLDELLLQTTRLGAEYAQAHGHSGGGNS